LKSIYPEHAWKTYKGSFIGHTFGKRTFKNQFELFKMLEGLFPDTTMVQNFRIQSNELQPDVPHLKHYEFDVSLQL
jgi:hypothetical protein